MEREFVTYEQALALQELGCGVIMNYKYWKVEKNILVFHDNYNMQFIIDKGFDVECLNVHAPLKQQVLRWFREKYGLIGLIEIGTQEFSYNIYDNIKDRSVLGTARLSYNGTYEEAENACIDKLIELAKQQKDNGKNP